MLLADGNGGYVFDTPTPTPVGDILDGASTVSATIATPSATPTMESTVTKTGGFWLYWLLIGLVIIVGGLFIFKKVLKK
jgi:hypothetical protein